MSRKLAAAFLLAAGILFTHSNILAYKKIKCFMPQIPEISLQGVKRVAVLDFKTVDFSDAQVGNFISDKIIEYMLLPDRGISSVSGGLFKSSAEGRTLIAGINTKCFELVERSRMEAVLRELSLGEAGLVTENQASKIGELLGADLMIYGNATASVKDVKSFETHERYKDKKKVKYLSACLSRTVTVTASIRIQKVAGGQILSVKTTTKTIDDKVCDDQRDKIKETAEMLGACVNSIAWEFSNMFNPWYEYEEFEFEKVKLDKVKDVADKACEDAENFELARAYAVLNKLYQEDSYNPQYLYNMGILFEVTGDFERAKELYDGAASLMDEKRFKTAAARMNQRIALVPFFKGMGMEIRPYDLSQAARSIGPETVKVKVRGSKTDRIEIRSAADPAAEVIARVPGDVLLEVIREENGWYLVKLLGGQEGYLDTR
jgi:hypothetical protein